MTLTSGDLRRTNAAFLVLALPIMGRLWIEAVVWRLERGPQMLLFSLAHAGAGLATPVLILSFLSVAVYWVWVLVVTVRWLLPGQRQKMTGVLRAIVGAVSVFAFSRVAEFLQTPLGRLQLYTGIVVLTAVAGFTAVLGLSGLTSFKRTSPAP